MNLLGPLLVKRLVVNAARCIAAGSGTRDSLLGGARDIPPRPGPWLPPPGEFWLACRRTSTRPTRELLWVCIATQRVTVFEWGQVPSRSTPPARARGLRASTSRFGVGQIEHSQCTPLGLHRIAQKVGGGWPVGTIFRGRLPRGFTWRDDPQAPIAHRILWLEGLEPGLNRGGHVDSFRRYIYIHGVGDETTLGRPASHGCVHLAAEDLLPLYDRLPMGTLVWISRT